MAYLVDKIGTIFLTLFGVASLVFFLFTVLPGDPAQMMLDQNEDSAQLEVIKAKFGFNLPLSQQYFYYLNDLSPFSVHSTKVGNFSYYNPTVYGGWKLFSTADKVWVLKAPYLRTSYQKRGKPITEILKETLPNTAVLAVSSMCIAIILGIFFGVVATLNKDTWIDRLLQLISTLGVSGPSFFSAILFSWFFGYVLHDYTQLNMTGSLYELDDLGESYSVVWKNLILPSFVLGIRPLAVIMQLMRSNLLEVLSQDYIRTAYSKGLSKYQVVFRHGLKNALNPVITAISGWFASLLAGAIFVEYIFGWKGLGKEIVEALNQLDIPVVMGAVLVIAFLFIIINIVVDFIYAYLDPRIKTT
ncbi:MAG: peptide/nickel transport system permease protein [Flavobacteriaceae bacterium]|jgi:peptide/nickel transport system permease protein